VRYHYTDTYLSKYLTEDILSGKEVLEVGCGQGIDASEISKYCASYVGVDLSGRSLEIAWSELRKLESAGSLLSGQDAERLAFKDNTFHVVFSIGVLHHTANFEDALGQIH
jgi:demethylmenaquinone methyltransferase/2-methoxy-6-polyprenyl-1,4-benzoquinol methylase